MRHRAKIVTTRKEHGCWFCGMRISIGARVLKFFAVESDAHRGAIHGYSCATCETINFLSETRTRGSELEYRY